MRESTRAITQVNTGALTEEQALHRAVRSLERSGITTITYRNTKTGKQSIQNKVDVAVRRHVRTQLAQDGQRLTHARMEQAGVELVEVSSHPGSRPSHALWEGRVYSLHGDKTIEGVRYKDFRSACKPGDVGDGIGGANCRHAYGPYFHGAKRSYHPNPKHPSGLSHEEIYTLTQTQRAAERSIRATKREIRGATLLYEADKTRANLTEVSALKLRLQGQQAGLRTFIAANDKVLQRSPRREWAGDMPKVKIKHQQKPDIIIGRSLGAAAFQDKVRLPDGMFTTVTQGTRITKVFPIAGKGSKNKINNIECLLKKYGGTKAEWSKVRGNGFVDDLGMSRACELHWYEKNAGARVEMKVKKFYI